MRNNCVFFFCIPVHAYSCDLSVCVCACVCACVCVCVCGKELMDKRMYFYVIVLTCMHVACVGGRVIKSGRSGREGIKYRQL